MEICPKWRAGELYDHLRIISVHFRPTCQVVKESKHRLHNMQAKGGSQIVIATTHPSTQAIYETYNWFAHGHKLEVMDEMFSAWIETHNNVVVKCDWLCK